MRGPVLKEQQPTALRVDRVRLYLIWHCLEIRRGHETAVKNAPISMHCRWQTGISTAKIACGLVEQGDLAKPVPNTDPSQATHGVGRRKDRGLAPTGNVLAKQDQRVGGESLGFRALETPVGVRGERAAWLTVPTPQGGTQERERERERNPTPAKRGWNVRGVRAGQQSACCDQPLGGTGGTTVRLL